MGNSELPRISRDSITGSDRPSPLGLVETKFYVCLIFLRKKCVFVRLHHLQRIEVKQTYGSSFAISDSLLALLLS